MGLLTTTAPALQDSPEVGARQMWTTACPTLACTMEPVWTESLATSVTATWDSGVMTARSTFRWSGGGASRSTKRQLQVCNVSRAEGEARCANGGECVDGLGQEFSCICSQGWEGETCEQEVSSFFFDFSQLLSRWTSALRIRV